MKKLSMIFMAAMLVLAMSCKKEKDEDKPVNKGFSATMEAPTGDDKTHLEGLKVKWDGNEVISVHNGTTTPLNFTFDKFNEQGSAIFINAEAPASFFTENYTAYYPASQNGSISLQQSYEAATWEDKDHNQHVSVGQGVNPMVAYSHTNQLQFRNVCGMLAIRLTGSNISVANISLTAKNGEMLCGTATVDLTDPNEPELSDLSGDDCGSTVTLDCSRRPVVLSTDKPTTFYFLLPPVELSNGIEVSLTDTEGKMWNRSASSPIVIKRHKSLKMPDQTEPIVTHVNINNVDLTVTGSTTPYTVNGSVEVSASTTCEYGVLYCPSTITGDPIATNSTRIKFHELSGAAITGTNNFDASSNINGLAPGTYKVRAYATLDNSEFSYSNTIATVTIPQPVTITSVGLTVSGSTTPYTVNGSVEVSASTTCEYGILYCPSTITGDPIATNSTRIKFHELSGAAITGTNNFNASSNINGLAPGIYKVRAYATLDNSEFSYSNTIATVTIPQPITITSVGLTVSGSTTPYTVNGSVEVSASTTCEYGVLYCASSTSGDPTVANATRIKFHELSGAAITGTNNFNASSNINGLAPGTYKVRAYATLDNSEFSYSNTIATVTIPQPITITSVDLTVTGSTTPYTVTGSVAVSASTTCEYGVLYCASSTSGDPTVANATRIKFHELTGAAITGTNNFNASSNINNLPAGSYKVRAYATLDNTHFSYSNNIATVTIPQPVTATPSLSQGRHCSIFTYTVNGGVTLSASGTCEYGIVIGTSQNPTTANSKIYTTSSTFSGSQTYTVDLRNSPNGVTLTPDQTYYVRAYAICNGTTTYSSQLSVKLPKPWTNGASPYPFKGGLYFSHGNLQYNATGAYPEYLYDFSQFPYASIGGTWQFASNQYDYIGNNNIYANHDYTGWIDLFNFGTSGYIYNNNRTYVPWCNQTASTNNLNGYSDWGYNKISNGGNAENQWRTPTIDEWNQLASSNRIKDCRVCGVNGCVVMPENWTGTPAAEYSANTNPSWAEAEAAGLVFLPHSGSVQIINYIITGYGWGNEAAFYWSSTFNQYAWAFQNPEKVQAPLGDSNNFKAAVRLVRK